MRHVNSLLLPNPLGSTGERLAEQVFARRSVSGSIDETSGVVMDQVFMPRGRNHFSLAGGGLSGYFPSPNVVPDVESLVVAGQVFGPKISNR